MATPGWETVVPRTSSFDYNIVKLQNTNESNKKSLIIQFQPASYFFGVAWTLNDLIIVRIPRNTQPWTSFDKLTTIHQLPWKLVDDDIRVDITGPFVDRILLTCNIGTMYYTATFLLSAIPENGLTVYGMFNYVSLSNITVTVNGLDTGYVEALIAIEGSAIRHRAGKLVLWSLYNVGTHLKFGRLIDKVGRDPETGYFKGVVKKKDEIRALNIPQGEAWYYAELWANTPLDTSGTGLSFFIRVRGVGLRTEGPFQGWKARDVFRPPEVRLESDFSYAVHPEAQEDDSLAIHKAHLLAQSIIRDLGYIDVPDIDSSDETHLPIGSVDCIAAPLDLLYRRSEEVTRALNGDYKLRRRRAAIAPQIIDPAVPSIQTYQNIVRGMLQELSASRKSAADVQEKLISLENKIMTYVSPSVSVRFRTIEDRLGELEKQRGTVSLLEAEFAALKKTHQILDQTIRDQVQQGSDFTADLANVRSQLQGAASEVKSRLGADILTIFKPIIKLMYQDIGRCMKLGDIDQVRNDVNQTTAKLGDFDRRVTSLENRDSPRLFYLADKSEIKAAAGSLDVIASHVYLGWIGQKFLCPAVLGPPFHHDRFIQGVYYKLVACTIQMVHLDRGTMILLVRDAVPPDDLHHDVESEIILDQCDHVPGIVMLSRDRVSPVDYIEVYEVASPGVFTISFSHLIAIYIPRCPGLRLLP
uniref:VP7 n=1 Tax=Eyach virus TaxID=62352 RepID=A0A8G0VJQ5_9REOV|nr:VP7 [Eyach virus]